MMQPPPLPNIRWDCSRCASSLDKHCRPKREVWRCAVGGGKGRGGWHVNRLMPLLLQSLRTLARLSERFSDAAAIRCAYHLQRRNGGREILLFYSPCTNLSIDRASDHSPLVSLFFFNYFMYALKMEVPWNFKKLSGLKRWSVFRHWSPFSSERLLPNNGPVISRRS